MVRRLVIGAALLMVGFLLWRLLPGVDRLKGALMVSPFQPALARKEIAADIKTYGAKKSYERIKEFLSTSDNVRQHSVAHIFGEVLYREQGLSGITVCDGSLGFGCYHSFFSKAIGERGKAIVAELDRTCVASYGVMGLGCPHGIGHGLGEYFGPSRVDEQLALCETLSWKGKYMGCQSGVFMEYNTPVTSGDGLVSTKPRPWEEDRPYGICLDVSEKFRPSCFLELPGWWEQVIPDNYKKMGDLCGRLKNPSDRESCFLGIGYITVQSHGYDMPRVKQICASFSSQGALLCRAGASWSFFANPKYRQEASQLCEFDTEKEVSLCQHKSDLLAN